MLKSSFFDSLWFMIYAIGIITYASLLIVVPLSPVIFGWSDWWYVILIPLEVFLLVFLRTYLLKLLDDTRIN